MSLRIAFRLMRPFTLLPPILGMASGAVSAFASGRATAEGGRAIANLLLGTLMAALLNGASNVLNQVHDLEIDRINKPERPLPRGEISLRGANRLSMLLYSLALISAFWIRPDGSPEVFVIVLVTAFLTWAYSAPPLRFRNSYWAAPLVIAIPRGGLLKVAGWGTLAPVFSDREPWILGGLFFLFVLGGASIKDFEDVPGDRKHGVTSLPIRFGNAGAARIMAPFYVLPWILLAFFSALSLGGLPLLSIPSVPGIIGGMALAAIGLRGAIRLLREAQGLAGTRLGRGVWKDFYVHMMVAQLLLAVLYLLRLV